MLARTTLVLAGDPAKVGASSSASFVFSCTPAAVVATRLACCRAIAIPRSSALVRTRTSSGITKEATMAVLMIATMAVIRRRTSGLGLRSDQLQPDAADGLQVAGLGRGLTQLATQPTEMDVDGPVAATIGLMPDLGQ